MYLDANVLIYAVTQDGRYGAACTQWLKRIESGQITVATSALLLVECLHVFKSLNRILGKKRRRAIDISGSLNAVLSLPIRWLELTPSVVLRASEVDAPLTAGDAVHVSTMEIHGISEILSADAGFDRVSGIRRRDPLAL